jgi:formylglycine-generating enzyme required for sulfatase activity
VKILRHCKALLLLVAFLLTACGSIESTAPFDAPTAPVTEPTPASLTPSATPVPAVTAGPTPVPPTETATGGTTASDSQIPTSVTATRTPPAQAAQPSQAPESTPSDGLDEPRTRGTDGMVMVYVPGGTFQMGSTDADVREALARCRESYRYCNLDFYGQEAPQHTVEVDGYWIDRTEVTHEQYFRCMEAGACQAPSTCEDGERVTKDASSEDHPVVCVDWQDAQTYCEWAGARLPTEAEWEYAARGPDGNLYPWGNEPGGALQNYCDATCIETWADESVDDGFAKTSPVYRYPEGASWCGALDLAGNVYEWVADWLGPYPSGPRTNPTGPSSGYERVLRGSSWKSFWDRARGATRDSIIPDAHHDVIGFRCARSIEAPDQAATELPVSTGTPAPEAVTTPPQATQGTASPGTRRLGDARTRLADGMVMAYVPGGTFPMGSTEAEIDAVLTTCGEFVDPYGKCTSDAFEAEGPRHDVTLDGFWIDGTEVNNAQYKRCVDVGACRQSRLAREPAYNQDDYPVAGIPRQDAVDYCAWAGGRLPTEAEWEYAARGAGDSVFPWGDSFDCAGGNFGDDLTGCEDSFEGPAPVGSFPAGTSWCGAQDMAGNVWEWVADWYGGYPSEAVTNPAGPESGTRGTLRGGSWAYYPPFLRAAFRYPVPPTADYLAVGFRCVVPADE